MLGGVQVQSCPFYERPFFKVIGAYRGSNNEPKVEVSDNPLVFIFKLVKAGYGDIEVVKRMNSREVLQALSYEKFLNDYQATYMELNKK